MKTRFPFHPPSVPRGRQLLAGAIATAMTALILLGIHGLAIYCALGANAVAAAPWTA